MIPELRTCWSLVSKYRVHTDDQGQGILPSLRIPSQIIPDDQICTDHWAKSCPIFSLEQTVPARCRIFYLHRKCYNDLWYFQSTPKVGCADQEVCTFAAERGWTKFVDTRFCLCYAEFCSMHFKSFELGEVNAPIWIMKMASCSCASKGHKLGCFPFTCGRHRQLKSRFKVHFHTTYSKKRSYGNI